VWKFALLSALFGVGFVLSGRLDYLRLRNSEKRGHVVLQEAILVETIFDIVREINARGIPVLLVEQNAHKALEVAHRGYVLETGVIVKTGTGKELLESEDVQKAYLGM